MTMLLTIHHEETCAPRAASRSSSGRGCPSAPPRAIVAIVHGVKSHSGYYQWAAEQLVARGLAVYALDLHGRGKSEGERFYLEKFADYLDDVGTLLGVAKSRQPVSRFPARPQRRRGHLLRLHARAPGGARRAYLRELRLPGLRARLRAGDRQGAQPHRPARARPEPEDRGLLARPEAVQAMLDDPLIADEVQPTNTVAELVRADERLDGSSR